MATYTAKEWTTTADHYANNVGIVTATAVGYLLQLTGSLTPLSNESMVLDVGTGTGAVPLTISTKSDCKIMAIDISDQILAKVDRHNILNLETRLVDGHKLTKVFGPDFTHAFSTFLIQYTPTPMIVLRGMRDSLRDGGLIGVAIWGPSLATYDIWEKACREIDKLYKMPDPFAAGAWRTTAELEKGLVEAGFDEVKVDERVIRFDLMSAREWTDFWFNGRNPTHDLLIEAWNGSKDDVKAMVEKVCREEYGDGKDILISVVLGCGRKI